MEITYGADSQLVGLDEFFSKRKRVLFPGLNFGALALENGQLMSDSEYEDAIIRKLMERGFCLLKAPEGRGKTILSLYVAGRLFKDNYSVYRTKKNWDWNTVRSSIDSLIETDKKFLFILEDVHLLGSDADTIIEYIEGIQSSLDIYNGSFQCVFLLNYRPTSVGRNKMRLNSSYMPRVDLSPVTVQQERSQKLAIHLAHRHHLILDQLTIDGVQLTKEPQRNLRVLSRYFDVFSNPDMPSKSATKDDVIHLFVLSFMLNEYVSSTQREMLLLLGALGVFEASLDLFFLTDAERNSLYIYRKKGLCFEAGNKVFLDHSTEARYLCRALCSDYSHEEEINDVYEKKVSEAVVRYFERITKQDISDEKKLDVVNTFIFPIIQSLLYAEGLDGFGDLKAYFRKPETATIIIRKIYPSYIMYALSFKGRGSESLKKKIYDDNKVFLKEHVLELRPPVLRSVYLALSNYYEYEGMAYDFFGDEDASVLESYVEKQVEDEVKIGKGQLSSAVCSISKRHKAIIATYYQEHRAVFAGPVINGAYKEARDIHKCIQSGQKSIDEARSIIQVLIEEVRNKIQYSPVKESSRDLSLFLYYVSLIDQGLYNQVLNDNVFLNSVSSRINRTKMKIGDLYLFGHFYTVDNTLRSKINRRIRESSPEERIRMEEWITLIREHNPGIVFDKNTMAYSIEKHCKNLL